MILQKKLLKLVRKQLKSIMENLPMKSKHIFIGIYNYIFNHNKKLSTQRMLICEKCQYKLILDNYKFCDICGCSLILKTTVKEEHCPANKW